MNTYNIIIYIITFFFVLGMLDFVVNGKLGLGSELQKGFMTGGKLLIFMGGYICLSPVLARVLRPIFLPYFHAIGADPSLLAGLLFSVDAGGAPLALELAYDNQAALFNGYIIGSIIGPTITFTIPVSLASVTPLNKRDNLCIVYGLISGIITAPVGILIGGLVAGFTPSLIIFNLWPIVLFTALFFITLLLFREYLVNIFIYLGRLNIYIAYLGFTVASIEKLTGIIVIPNMAPIDTVFPIVGNIVLILAGAFPMIAFITRNMPKLIEILSHSMNISDVSISGLFATTVNSIVTLGMLKEMDDRGKTINIAFSVAAAWAIGDHLGFIAYSAPSILIPVLVSKFTAGLLAICLASYSYNKFLR